MLLKLLLEILTGFVLVGKIIAIVSIPTVKGIPEDFTPNRVIGVLDVPEGGFSEG
jgi:hypothetical protein